MTRRLVVIGNGMAATRLVQRLVERDPARFAITVVGDEPHPAYNRIQLSPLLAGEKRHRRSRCCRRSGTPGTGCVCGLARRWMKWMLRNGGCASLTPGCRGTSWFSPPARGPLSRRCRALIVRRLCPSALGGRGTYSGDTRPGGGDWRWGSGRGGGGGAASPRREVTLLHRGSGLMAPLIDAFAADELRQQLEARGIRCVLECRIAAIDADGVQLADGRVFRAARVVLATGVQPNSRLAAQSGVLCQQGSWLTARWPPRCRGSAPSASVAKLTARHGGWWLPACASRGAGGSPVRRPRRGLCLAGRRDPPEGHRH